MKSFLSCDSVTHEGKTNVWLTPLEIIKALGPFDLDPCGESHWPTATKIFTERGLEMGWYGRIWLNPPYGKEIGKWLRKLDSLCSYKGARTPGGIALVFARTDTEWFQSLKHWDAIKFVKGRIAFHKVDGSKSTNAGAPSMLIAWGKENVMALDNIEGVLVQRIYAC